MHITLTQLNDSKIPKYIKVQHKCVFLSIFFGDVKWYTLKVFSKLCGRMEMANGIIGPLLLLLFLNRVSSHHYLYHCQWYIVNYLSWDYNRASQRILFASQWQFPKDSRDHARVIRSKENSFWRSSLIELFNGWSLVCLSCFFFNCFA